MGNREERIARGFVVGSSVMRLYARAKTKVRVSSELSEDFDAIIFSHCSSS